MVGFEFQSHINSEAVTGWLRGWSFIYTPLNSSTKDANSVLGLLGGDLGEVDIGVFLLVELSDIKAEDIGETLVEYVLYEPVSLWASLNMRT